MAERKSAEPMPRRLVLVQGDSTEPVGRDDRFAIEAVVTGHRHLTATRRGPPPATLRLLRQPNGFEGFAAVHVAHAASGLATLIPRDRHPAEGYRRPRVGTVSDEPNPGNDEVVSVGDYLLSLVARVRVKSLECVGDPFRIAIAEAGNGLRTNNEYEAIP